MDTKVIRFFDIPGITTATTYTLYASCLASGLTGGDTVSSVARIGSGTGERTENFMVIQEN